MTVIIIVTVVSGSIRRIQLGLFIDYCGAFSRRLRAAPCFRLDTGLKQKVRRAAIITRCVHWGVPDRQQE